MATEKREQLREAIAALQAAQAHTAERLAEAARVQPLVADAEAKLRSAKASQDSLERSAAAALRRAVAAGSADLAPVPGALHLSIAEAESTLRIAKNAEREVLGDLGRAKQTETEAQQRVQELVAAVLGEDADHAALVGVEAERRLYAVLGLIESAERARRSVPMRPETIAFVRDAPKPPVAGTAHPSQWQALQADWARYAKLLETDPDATPPGGAIAPLETIP